MGTWGYSNDPDEPLGHREPRFILGVSRLASMPHWHIIGLLLNDGSHHVVSTVSTLCSPRDSCRCWGEVRRARTVASTPPHNAQAGEEPTHWESECKIMQTRSSNQSNTMQRESLWPLDRAPIDPGPNLHDSNSLWFFTCPPGISGLKSERYQFSLFDAVELPTCQRWRCDFIGVGAS